jgi:hypothetical protein
MGVLWTVVSPNAGFIAAGTLAIFSAIMLYSLRLPKQEGQDADGLKRGLLKLGQPLGISRQNTDKEPKR